MSAPRTAKPEQGIWKVESFEVCGRKLGDLLGVGLFDTQAEANAEVHRQIKAGYGTRVTYV